MPRELDQYFTDRVRRSARLALLGAVLLIPAAAGVTFLTYWVVWLMVLAGPGALFEFTFTTVHVLAAIFVVVLFAWYFGQQRDLDETFRISGEGGDDLRLSVPALTGYGWVLMLNPGMAGHLVRIISLLFLTGPRMIALAHMLYQRSQRLANLDPIAASQMVSHLVKTQGRVPVAELANRCPSADVEATIRALCDVDGIVFLHKDKPALTLAPRFLEDYQEWIEKEQSSSGETATQDKWPA